MVHVNELTVDRASVAMRHHAVYRAVWEDVETKVMAANRAGAQELQYRLSALHIIMLGQPLVSSQRAARYVRDKLTRNGFAVIARDLGQVGVVLDISWQARKVGSMAACGTNIGEAAKSEVQRHVIEFIVEPLCAVFDELYALAQQQDGRLLTFQMQLRAIPKWSAVTVTKWVTKVLSACGCFEELVTALFLSHIKLLSSIRLSHATLKVKIPRNEKFIHAVMILAAKEFYENPRMFRQKAHAEKARVLAHALNKTVRDMLPMKDLLQEYLAQKPDAAAAKQDDDDDVRIEPPLEPSEDPLGHEPLQLADDSATASSLQLADIANETVSSLGGKPVVADMPSPAVTDGFVEEIKRIDIGDVKPSQQLTSLVASDEPQLVFPPPPPSSHDSNTASAPASIGPQQQPAVSTEEVLLDDILLNHHTAVRSPTAATTSKHSPNAFFSDAEM
ncbi:hypothetical protein OEZ85_011021 [Tetradesmus obliquus]|uniref:Uncharacterized protein n=1 Tax=Tetradesmus obliquus TaxID=3088 RepID=A0ABY8TP01_TETOB|nr:hypothetical protein OEZ85_011021 [Tetradesmus obliquus]